MVLFEVCDFSIGYGQEALAEGLNFQVDSGQLQPILGPSGCGKTCLLRSLSGLINPLKGSVLLEGESPDTLGWSRYRRQAILVAQQPRFQDETVIESFRRPFRYGAVSAGLAEEQIAPLFTQLCLERAVLDQHVRKLSLGQQQRVALIRALLLNPKLIFLDECTSALDQENRARVEQLLLERAATGLAIIFVSHDSEQIKTLGNAEAVQFTLTKSEVVAS
jgi:putative ABC transport system ATP-binding protein